MTVNKEKISCCVSSSHMIKSSFWELIQMTLQEAVPVQTEWSEAQWYMYPEMGPNLRFLGFIDFLKYFELWENCYKVFQRLNRLEQNPGRKTGLDRFFFFNLFILIRG